MIVGFESVVELVVNVCVGYILVFAVILCLGLFVLFLDFGGLRFACGVGVRCLVW